MFFSPKTSADGLVFHYDTGNTVRSYLGEPTTNLWGIQSGTNVNNKSGWSMPYSYNGAITNSIYSSGTWNGNRIWEVLHTAGTSGYAGHESWRECVDQPTAGSGTYGTTRRVAMKICILEGSITDLALHSGGGNGGHSGGAWTAIPASQVPKDCPVKTGWYQFLEDGSWNSNSVGHCIGLGFISYNRVKLLIAEPMYYPSSKLLPFTGYQRGATQGLKDLTAKSTIDISTVSFDSNAQMTFDGTDDTLSTGRPLTALPALSNFTIECIAKIDAYPTAAPPNFYNNTTRAGVLLGAAYYSGTALYWYGNNSGTACTIYAYIRGADAYRTAGGFNLTPGRYHHLVLVNDYSGGTIKLYANGTLNGSATTATQEYNPSLTPSAGNIGISKAQVDGGGESVYSYLPCQVPSVKIFNRALTADEVTRNYNAIKSRFNIG